jgi:hypothetical protein
MTQFTRKQISDANELLSKSLPCHVVAVEGAIVTVAFDVTTEFTLPQVKMPVLESQYVRLPIQVGDRGITIGADTLISHITGLGGGAAPIVAQPPNLAALVFVPIGNAAWVTRDANAVVIEAPNGAIIRTQDGNSIVTVSDTEIRITRGDNTVIVVSDTDLTMTRGDTSITMNGTDLNISGTNITIAGTNVDINGVVKINSKPYLSHKHSGVFIGTSNSGPVAP